MIYYMLYYMLYYILYTLYYTILYYTILYNTIQYNTIQYITYKHYYMYIIDMYIQSKQRKDGFKKFCSSLVEMMKPATWQFPLVGFQGQRTVKSGEVGELADFLCHACMPQVGGNSAGRGGEIRPVVTICHDYVRRLITSSTGRLSGVLRAGVFCCSEDCYLSSIHCPLLKNMEQTVK